ncbi:Uncharacterised protein [Mycobacteroides abscessus]|nr:Uncharacterised protein [Mycobacteroides abscessus]
MGGGDAAVGHRTARDGGLLLRFDDADRFQPELKPALDEFRALQLPQHLRAFAEHDLFQSVHRDLPELAPERLPL